jgi:putative nucleotidyltransferase with HDIG domain
MTDIQGIIDDIETLKPIPPIAVQIMGMAADPNRSMDEIADLIVVDPFITANLLKVCNSAYFGLSRKVESLRDAMSLLGLDHVVDLVLVSSVSETYSTDQQGYGYGLGEGALWRHAVTSAYIAKVLAEKKGAAQNKHLLFTAALLKDIGKLILGRFVAFSLEMINILVQSKGYSFNDAEKEILGLSHEELGGQVAEKWSFSEKMIYIIRNHHLSDETARKDRDTTIIYLADIICMIMGVGTGVDGLAYHFYNEVLNRLGINDRDVHTIIAETSANHNAINQLVRAV